jgi:ferredoxin
MVAIDVEGFDHVLRALQARGYSLLGPVYREGAIVIDAIVSVHDLPRGYVDTQAPASYSVTRNDDEALFGFVLGPVSWKKFLYPPRLKLFSMTRSGKGFEVSPNETPEVPKYACIGIRPCELQAIAIQDKIFSDGQYTDPVYSSVRKQLFTVVVQCARPAGNCFCASMNTGPKAYGGYDLALTEILHDDSHYFVVDAGSGAGNELLAEIPHRPATEVDIERANTVTRSAAEQLTKSMETTDLPRILNESFEHPLWDDIARRCLSCANCTLVCPTCFCSTVEDVTDLTGAHAERWRRWDSCFTSDFTRIAGGNIRMSTRTRYRQWLTHKVGNWVDQFGTSGCVGCGRCITWCPVGIDLTVEVRKFRDSHTMQS